MLKIMVLTAQLFTIAVPPSEKLNKNEEYVCVRWTGSSDPTQHNPSVCITWVKKEKPWYKKHD
jgi:hypothetical protein